MSAKRLKVAVISDIHLLAQSENLDALKPSRVDNNTTRDQIKRLIKHAGKLEESVEKGEADEAHFVLNGDIFEFIFPRGEPQEAVLEAVNFMKTMAERFPRCHFHYIHGNHDPITELNHQLTEITSQPQSSDYLGNLSVHKTHCIIGDALFTHGDILLGEHPQDDKRVRPPRRLEDSSRIMSNAADMRDGRIYEFIIDMGTRASSLWSHTQNAFSSVYSALILRRDLEKDAAKDVAKGLKKKPYRAKMGEFYSNMQWQIQRWLEGLRSPVNSARTIAGALAEAHPEMFDVVNHVFTGHTHIPYANIEIKKGLSLSSMAINLPHPLMMHNSGAPLAGARANLMTIDMVDGKVSNIEVGSDYRKRLPRDISSPTFEKDLERFADDLRDEALEAWHKRIEKKSGVRFDEPGRR